MGDSLSPVGAYCRDAVLTLCLRFREHAVGLKAAGRHHVSLKVVLAMNWLLLVDFSGATSAGEIPQDPDLPQLQSGCWEREITGSLWGRILVEYHGCRQASSCPRFFFFRK